MKILLRDTRVQRLLLANTLGSIGSGITIFSVPWLLVHRPGGSEAYRWATLATTLVLFAFMPGYGAWLDRHSRKTALLASEAWGFLATTSMAGLGLALGGFPSWQLMTIYFCGMCYYTLHYPAKFAFIQQIFDRSHYQSLVGSMIVVDWWGPPAGFLLLFAIMLAALAGVYASRATLHETSQPVPAPA